jgi:hypothetical protein
MRWQSSSPPEDRDGAGCQAFLIISVVTQLPADELVRRSMTSWPFDWLIRKS